MQRIAKPITIDPSNPADPNWHVLSGFLVTNEVQLLQQGLFYLFEETFFSLQHSLVLRKCAQKNVHRFEIFNMKEEDDLGGKGALSTVYKSIGKLTLCRYQTDSYVLNFSPSHSIIKIRTTTNDDSVRSRMIKEAFVEHEISKHYFPYLEVKPITITNTFVFSFMRKLGKDLHAIDDMHNAATILDTVIQVANAIYYFHKHNLMHADIKLENITRKGFVVNLIDVERTKTFNASLTNLLGTIGYLAPERFFPHVASGAIDVYAFGALIWAIAARFLTTKVNVSTREEFLMRNYPNSVELAASISQMDTSELAKKMSCNAKSSPITPEAIAKVFYDELQQIVIQLVASNAEQRPNIKTAFDSLCALERKIRSQDQHFLEGRALAIQHCFLKEIQWAELCSAIMQKIERLEKESDNANQAEIAAEEFLSALPINTFRETQFCITEIKAVIQRINNIYSTKETLRSAFDEIIMAQYPMEKALRNKITNILTKSIRATDNLSRIIKSEQKLEQLVAKVQKIIESAKGQSVRKRSSYHRHGLYAGRIPVQRPHAQTSSSSSSCGMQYHSYFRT